MHVGERFNSISHLVGAVLSVVGLVALVTMGALEGDPYKVVSFSVYGAMLILLYAISTLYHSVRNPRLKAILQKCDHSAIYLLIAGYAVHAGHAARRGLVAVRRELGAGRVRDRAGADARAARASCHDPVRGDGLALSRCAR